MDHAGADSHHVSVYSTNAYNCWSGMSGRSTPTGTTSGFTSRRTVTARDSYFYGTAHAASQSYGAEQFMAADNLVENNIFQHITAPMMNAAPQIRFGYNYRVDDTTLLRRGAGELLSPRRPKQFHSLGGNDGPRFSPPDNIHGADHSSPRSATLAGWSREDAGHHSDPARGGGTRYYNVVGNVMGKNRVSHRDETAAPSSTDGRECLGGARSIFTLGYSGMTGTILSRFPDTLVKATMMRWATTETVHAPRMDASEVPSG